MLFICPIHNTRANGAWDAIDFLADFRSTPTLPVMQWSNLKTLCLPSHRLRPNIWPRRCGELLIAAGRATTFMPKLECLEIWNSSEEYACYFRYTNEHGNRLTILFATNWPQIPCRRRKSARDELIQFWVNLPRHHQHLHGNLLPRFINLLWTPKKSHATIIRYLFLNRHILDDLYSQVLWEEENNRLQDLTYEASWLEGPKKVGKEYKNNKGVIFHLKT